MPIQPGQQPSRAQYNRAEEQTRRLANMRGGPGVRFRNTPAGVQIGDTVQPIWAQLTAAPAGMGQGYAWQEIVDDGAGGQQIVPGGGSGTTTSYQAFPWNGISVPLTGADGQPTVVLLWPAPNSETMVFAALGGTTSSGGDVPIRITGTYQKDPDEATGCSGSPSPLCYYPGVIQTLDCSGWHDSATTVWVVFWYGYGSVPPITGTNFTVVIVDGTTAFKGWNAGFNYNPNSAGSRPVYGSTEFAAAWAIGCQVIDGVAQPVPVLGG